MPELEEQRLSGAIVAFTGRLASMTHEEAAELVRAYGGSVVQKPTRACTLLVVGEDLSLLERDGRITRNLERARELQKRGTSIRILPEKEFLRTLGLEDEQEGVHRYYTMAQLSRVLGIPRDRLRRWVRVGLIQPVKEVHRLCYFEFQQVRDAKTLAELSQAGVPVERIRESLDKLRRWMPELDQPIANLDLVERDGKLLVRLEGKTLVEPSGQMVFDLSRERPPVASEEKPALRKDRTLDEWLDLALHHEEAGRLDAAEIAYREALFMAGPQPVLCFNLANVLYALDRKERAVERFFQAVEVDPEYVEAWNNLGNVLGDLEELDSAIEAYSRAIDLAPDYADPHYNLAETYRLVGNSGAARQHWLAYLRLDPQSPWADRIRENLKEEE